MALTTNSMMTFGLLHSSLMKTARAQVSVQEEAIYTAQCREYAVRCGCAEPLHHSSRRRCKLTQECCHRVWV